MTMNSVLNSFSYSISFEIMYGCFFVSKMIPRWLYQQYTFFYYLLCLSSCFLAVCAAHKHKQGEKHPDHHGHNHHGNHHNKHHGHHKHHSHHEKSVQKTENEACVKKYFSGCNINNHLDGICECKKMLACKNPFHYKTQKDCIKDKKGTYSVFLK